MGGYNGYLSLAITTKLFDNDEQLTEAYAFQNSVSQTISLTGQALGVFLLGVVSYNYSLFGLINASLYFCGWLILIFIKQKLERKVGQFKVGHTEKINVSNFFKETKENLKILKEKKVIYNFTKLFLGMNFYSSAMHITFLLVILTTPSLYFYNLAYTITFVEIVETISMICGGIVPLSFLKRMPLKYNLLLEILMFVFYVLNIIFLQNKIVLLIIICLIGYLAGISNPKLDVLILKSVPEEKQGAVFSIFGTIITLSVPLATMLFSVLANITSVILCCYVLLIVVIILFIYNIYLVKFEKVKEQD